MSLFRSERMTLCQILLHSESAFNCLIELGYVGKVQFRNIFDGKPLINAQYTNEFRRCIELKHIIEYLQKEIDDFKIKIVIYPDVDADEIPEADDLKDMETTLHEIYDDLMQVVTSVEGLKQKHQFIYEHLQVIKNIEGFFGQSNQAVLAWTDSVIMNLLRNEVTPHMNGVGDKLRLSFMAGTIPVERFATFEILLFRLTRGYFVLKHKEIIFEAKFEGSKKFSRKNVFAVFYLGQAIRLKIGKVCQGFGIKIFECPESKEQRRELVTRLTGELKDIEEVIERTTKHRFNILFRASADIYIWRTKLYKMRMVYYILNRMGFVRHLRSSKYLQAECWIPTKDIGLVRDALILGARRTAKGSSRSMFVPMLNELRKGLHKEVVKPTYFILNKFTQGFQNLIDSYGTADYQEINPAPYTIITFPFLFAVMFGDMGHGIIMFIFGLWMVIKERELEEKNRFSTSQSEIWDILFAGRYIITLMGAFSVYTGLIYNDIFSKSFNIFGSSWRIPFNETTVLSNKHLQLDPNDPVQYLGTPYIMGVDPVWDASGENAIITSNSLKMKLAIILGIIQMVFGLLLSALNFIYYNNIVDLMLIFVPQIIFLLSIFGYLVFLIFFKWIYYGGHIEPPYNTACAPSILIVFINMLLMKGPEKPPEHCETWMFEMQPYMQTVLLTSALLCVPVLLAGKPIYYTIQENKSRKIENEMKRRTQEQRTQTGIRRSLIYSISEIGIADEKVDDKANIGELWIHSGIHCIESVLGAVSHTASYLRLWALSLAHDQLSTVLWNMVLKIGLTSKRGYFNSVILCVVFVFWAVLTVAILVVMEGLSAFLHCLRLHWVEFQSKFYSGSGEPFMPFKFQISSPRNID